MPETRRTYGDRPSDPPPAAAGEAARRELRGGRRPGRRSAGDRGRQRGLDRPPRGRDLVRDIAGRGQPPRRHGARRQARLPGRSGHLPRLRVHGGHALGPREAERRQLRPDAADEPGFVAGRRHELRALSAATAATISGAGAVENLFYGGGGDDVVLGADGSDELAGDRGVDDLFGDAGQDRLDGGFDSDRLLGGAGFDTADYSSRAFSVHVTIDGAADDGEDGEGDKVDVDVEEVSGGIAGDHLVGNDAANALFGTGGDDTIEGGGGNDATLAGGPGADHVDGGLGNDGLYGRPGADRLAGQAGDDLLGGEDDDDTLDGGLGADTMLGGAGADTVTYGARNAAVHVDLDGVAGDDGADQEGDTAKSDVERIVGGAGADLLGGNATANVIHGGAGDDEIDGGAGQDQLFGEDGGDTLRSFDGEADADDCGAADDFAVADALDALAGCESQLAGAPSGGDPIQSGEPGPAAPPAAPLEPASAAVGIGGSRVRLTRRGRVPVRVSCLGAPGSECEGVLRLERLIGGRARSAGKRSYSLAAGSTATVKVPVTRATRRALARRGRVKLRATAAGSVAQRLTLLPHRRR